MKKIFLSSLVFFTALLAFNLEAGHRHNNNHHHRHHHSRTNVRFNVGPVVAQPVVRPVVTYVQPVQVVTYAPEYYPVTTVEYVQPVVVQPRPAANFGLGFFTGFLTSSVLRGL